MKYDDLEKFIVYLKSDGGKGYRKEITFEQLKLAIAKKYGLSPYIQKNILSALVEYDLITEIGKWIYFLGSKSEYIKKEEKDEKEIEDEADSLLGSLEAAKVDK